MPNSISELIDNCKKGDRVSQMKLYDRYAGAMFKVALRYLKNEEDAKDAMQEGFIKLFVNIDRYDTEYTLGAWLKRMVINCCIDFLKKRSIDFDPLVDDEIGGYEESWKFNGGISKAQLLRAMDTLKDNYRIVVKLYLVEGYDHEEIAQILNIPQASSRTYLRRGRLQLQKILKS